MSTKESSKEDLDSTEKIVLDLLMKYRKDNPDKSLGNKSLAETLGISRSQAGKIRASLVDKLGRKPGF